jgi:serine/threonine protein phosphatase 1
MKRYVIGDVHGCYDELCALLDMIHKHADGNQYKIIFVGDYVDRGPDSKKVVDQIRLLEKEGCIALMGNHEDMLIAGEYMYAAETIVSFGGFRGHYIPDWAMDWMKALPKYYEDDTIIVAHAGANPAFSMNEQTDAMLLWLRYEQHQHAQLGKHFYHGHTPRLGKIEQVEDRTNVDTGCVYGGHLTAAIVGDDGKPEGFIQVPQKGGVYDMSDAQSRGWEA